MTSTPTKTARAHAIAVTPSRLREYQVCPQSYKLKIVDRAGGGEASAALAFGMSIHLALEEVHRAGSCANEMIDVRRLLRKHWKSDGYADEQEAGSYFTRGVEALDRYLGMTKRSNGHVIGTELYLSRFVRLNKAQVRLGCKADRIDLHPDGTLEVIDYKTAQNGRVPTPEWLTDDLPTFLYYLLALLTYPEHKRVIVTQLNVLTLAKVTVDYTGGARERNAGALRAVVATMVADDFTPRPGEACGWCVVRDKCPAFGEEVDLDFLLRGEEPNDAY